MAGSVNYLAIIAAAVAAFVFGAIFYGMLGKQWMKAARIDPSEAKMSPVLFATSFVCELVMAWVMYGVLAHIAPASLGGALMTAFLVWLGFMAATTTINQRYQGYGWDLTIIDSTHWLGVSLIMALVITLIG